ncbi:DNA-binding protein [Streptomyces sp. NPDC057545]|uniref:DNA-binding protein n=1 Tax=Streptomyces sp. NPDC057545 TaxID=3346164 RepID=UPI00369E7A00
MDVVMSAPTLIEAVPARTNKARSGRALSGLRVVPVGEEEARAASVLLMAAGPRGHEYALDAAVAEAALRQRRPVIVLTSDVDDMHKLCGDRVRRVAA